jgi:hypothetical protein
MPCQPRSNQMNGWTQQKAAYNQGARAHAYAPAARAYYAPVRNLAAGRYPPSAGGRQFNARARANQWGRRSQAQFDDCGSCKAVCAEGYDECEAHCCDFEEGSPEYEACRLQCEVDARECEHETCVGTGRCPEVLCPRPAPTPTPCQGCKLRCAADAVQCEDDCAQYEGVDYQLCKKACELAKFDCIERECFASKLCCNWEPTRPIDDDWEPTRPIDDDGEPTEPIDPNEPGEPGEPEPGEPGEPGVGALRRYLAGRGRKQYSNVTVFNPRDVAQVASRLGTRAYNRGYAAAGRRY